MKFVLFPMDIVYNQFTYIFTCILRLFVVYLQVKNMILHLFLNLTVLSYFEIIYRIKFL